MTIVFKFETIYHSYVGILEKLWNISDDKERISECEKVSYIFILLIIIMIIDMDTVTRH